MRVAVLVPSLFLMVVILLQSCAAGAVGAINSAIGKDAAETAQFSQGGAIGFVVAFLFLVGGAFAIGVPLVSFVVFLIAGVLAFSAARTTAFKDLGVELGICRPDCPELPGLERQAQDADANTATSRRF